MFDVKKIIEEITSEKQIKNLSFAGVGGSLACFYAAYYYVQREAKNITTSYTSATVMIHQLVLVKTQSWSLHLEVEILQKQ